jgi:hypothetical protein
MLGVGAIINTHGFGIKPDIPTGINVSNPVGSLPPIPTGIVASYIPEIPTNINLIQL